MCWRVQTNVVKAVWPDERACERASGQTCAYEWTGVLAYVRALARSLASSLALSLARTLVHLLIHIHTCVIYIYIYIYVCVCLCVCVCFCVVVWIHKYARRHICCYVYIYNLYLTQCMAVHSSCLLYLNIQHFQHMYIYIYKYKIRNIKYMWLFFALPCFDDASKRSKALV